MTLLDNALLANSYDDFDVLLTVHLSITLANDHLDAQLFYLQYVYYSPPHVSSNVVLIIRRSNCINLQAPRFLYIGQAFRYSPENAFYILNEQIRGIFHYLIFA